MEDREYPAYSHLATCKYLDLALICDVKGTPEDLVGIVADVNQRDSGWPGVSPQR